MAPVSLNAAQLDAESNKLHAIFEEGESEETWNKFDSALSRMTDITCGSWEVSTFAATVKQKWKFGIVVCLNSDRTKLVKNCLILIETIAGFLKERFDESLLVPTLKLCGKANKVIVNYASATLIHCIHSANGFPSLIPHFTDAYKNPSKTFRIAAIDGLVATVECCTKSKLETFIDKIEFAIGVFILDSLPQVRELARLLYSTFQEKFSTERLLASLPDTSKKYLKIEEKSQSLNWKTPKRNNQEQEARVASGSKRTILRSLTSPDVTPNLEKTVQGSVLQKYSTHREIGSTRVVNMFSKGSLKENVTKKTGEIKEFSLGGAMRVLRDPVATQVMNEGISRPTIKALRVPSLSSITADISAKPNNAVMTETTNIPTQSTEAGEKKLVLKRKIVVAEFTKAKKEEHLPDLATLYTWTKSSDWQTRCKAYETLVKLINSKDFKSSPKMAEMVLLGLDDTHFRVVNSVLEAINCLLDRNHHIEAFFAKTVNAVYNSKSRQSTFEHSEELLRKMVVALNDSAIHIILNMISEPGLMRKPRAKNGLLSMLCSIRLDFLSSYISKANNFKLLIHKLTSTVSDIEDKTQEMIKEIIKALYLLQSDSFWSIWSSLKTAEQNRINKLFGNDISQHRQLLGEVGKSAVLKLQKSVNSPVSRIPVMLPSPLTLEPSTLSSSIELIPENKSGFVEVEALENQHPDCEDKESEKTLKDEFDESSDDIHSEKDTSNISDNIAEVLDLKEIKNSAGSDMIGSVEQDQEPEKPTEDVNLADVLPADLSIQAVKPELMESLPLENYNELVSDFVDSILDTVVVQSYGPDDTQILSYINGLLKELAKELEVSRVASKELKKVLEVPIIKAPVPILKVASAAESLQQWHVPSQTGSPEINEESVIVEAWYIPSWTETSSATVTLNNLPDILTTLRSSNNEDELHTCLILLQSLLESHDADNFCQDILSALLENKTPLCLPDLDLKESILSKFPQYFSSEILFSSVEKSCHVSLRACLSILNDLLSLSSNGPQLLKSHVEWKEFLILGLQSNRSATRHTTEPLIYYSKVSGSTLRLIAKHENIGIPSASGFADAQASFGHFFTSFQTGAWKKVTVGQVGRILGEGAKITGFFVVGEMIGRRSIVGYDVGDASSGHH